MKNHYSGKMLAGFPDLPLREWHSVQLGFWPVMCSSCDLCLPREWFYSLPLSIHTFSGLVTTHTGTWFAVTGIVLTSKCHKIESAHGDNALWVWNMEETGCPGKDTLGSLLLRFQGKNILLPPPLSHTHLSPILCICKYSNHLQLRKLRLT